MAAEAGKNSKDEDDSRPKATQTSVESERDWNAEFQALLQASDSTDKYEKLSALSKDFVYAAKVLMGHSNFTDQRFFVEPDGSVFCYCLADIRKNYHL